MRENNFQNLFQNFPTNLKSFEKLDIYQIEKTNKFKSQYHYKQQQNMICTCKNIIRMVDIYLPKNPEKSKNSTKLCRLYFRRPRLSALFLKTVLSERENYTFHSDL
jgi:hypothetical protein